MGFADFIDYIFAAIILACLLSIPKLLNLLSLNKLYGYISWCYLKSNFNFRKSNLTECLRKIQRDSKYQIVSSSDWDYVELILISFRDELSNLFFQNQITLDHRKPTNEEFFIYQFYCFLKRHAGAESILKEDLSHYIGRDEFPYDSKYKLTSFGIVYQKLYYISLAYCQSNDKLSSLCRNNDLVHIAHDIDNGTIQFPPVNDDILAY